LQAEIDSLINILPGCPHAYLIKARFFESLMRLDEAIETYKKLLEAHPENMKALIRLGVCYYHNNQADESDDVFKKMYKIYKNRWEASDEKDLISRCSMVTVEMMFRPKDAVLAEWNDFFENLDEVSRNFAGYYHHTITKFNKSVMMKLYSNKPVTTK
jgi:tetratricopeptide (TPR) repeat protein